MRNTLRMGVTAVLALQISAQVKETPADQPGIHRRVMIDEKTIQAARVTYQPGALESPGSHPYDVVLVPLNPGTIRLNIPGHREPAWEPGEAIFVARGTEHRLQNIGSKPIEFVTIRVR